MQLNNLLEVRDFDIEECINHLEMLSRMTLPSFH